MSSNERPPSLVALAAAFDELDAAAVYVRGILDWLERFGGDARAITDDEAVRLWAFAERTRELARRINADSDRLTALLLQQFLTEKGEWPLTRDQEREYHEVLAALSAKETEARRQQLVDESGLEDPREREPTG
jgi:hypothetical protein